MLETKALFQINDQSRHTDCIISNRKGGGRESGGRGSQQSGGENGNDTSLPFSSHLQVPRSPDRKQ